MQRRAAKDQPLRDDIHLLGDLLGETLREQEGIRLYETVEKVRAIAKSGRAGNAEDVGRLSDLLRDLPTGEALPVARAFSHFLTLANIAEQHHRVRRRRDYAKRGDATPQPGSCRAVLLQLKEEGRTDDEIEATIRRLAIELVLTAHPTEIARRTLLHKHDRIAELLARGDHDDLTDDEQEEIAAEIKREITAAWKTDEVRHERPTPIDEVKAGLFIFERTLWKAVPRFFRTLDQAMTEVIGRELPLDAVPLRFGSWIGGDRDGNPNVTAAVTEETTLLSRWVAAELYLDELRELRTELSMSECSAAMREIAGDSREPYRFVIKRLERQVKASLAAIELMLPPGKFDPAAKLVSREEIVETLMLCYRSLMETKGEIIARGRLLDLIRRAHCFGATLVRLDIREDAAKHTALLNRIAREHAAGNYEQWSEEQRQEFLLAHLRESNLTIPAELGNDEPAWQTFRAIRRLPPESLGAYVITMASQPSDVLAVALLQKLAGVEKPLRVVPLFETNADLRGAARTMEALFAIDDYRERTGGRQEVMIGYSDSSKDAGRFAAAWALYKAQEEIVAVSRAAGIELTLFHGRGGSVGRGGGPTWLAIASQPPGSVDARLRVTVQGEMIQASFGLPEIAVRTLEVYTTATLEATLVDSPAPKPEWRSLMETLAERSRAAYREVVYERPEFIPYFRAVTPEVELGTINIGSRPARRGGGGGVESLRAIPWQFAWTQNRLLLASWLGSEAAFEEALRHPELVHEMVENWTFFRSTIDLLEMVLAKTAPDIALQYERALCPKELRPLGEELRERLTRAMELLLRATGRKELLEANPVLKRSIAVRNPYVDPINLVQVEVLRRYRENGDPGLWDAFVVTVNGIAAGMRNTG